MCHLSSVIQFIHQQYHCFVFIVTVCMPLTPRVSNHHTLPIFLDTSSLPHSPSLTKLPFLIIISLYPLKIQQLRSCNLVLHLKGIVTRIPPIQGLCDTGANDTDYVQRSKFATTKRIKSQLPRAIGYTISFFHELNVAFALHCYGKSWLSFWASSTFTIHGDIFFIKY